MELTPKQQVVERVKESKSILILTHQNPDGDALGSTLALEMFLASLGKNTLAVCNDAAPEVFSYLPNVKKIAQNFSGARDFIISLDTSEVRAEKIMYRSESGRLNIIITPKNGQFLPEMVKFPEGRFNFDLIIVLDTPDLERTGAPFEKNPDVFYETPVINIDHHASNDNFGKINLVDITATSTAEILVSLMEALSPEKSPFTEDIATALLTGIITDTGSFQNANTTPKSLTVAAQMVAAGARRDEIIKEIFKTRNLSTLRLWGRALVNLRDEKGDGFIWTTLRKQDFLEVGASEAESSGVIDELLKTVSGADFVMLLTEKGTSVFGSLRSVKQSFDVAKMAATFYGGGHSLAAGFELKNTTLSESSKMIVQRIRETKKEMNGKMGESISQ